MKEDLYLHELIARTPTYYFNRPNDWLTMPIIQDSEQLFYGLYAVQSDDAENYLSFSVAGDYSVCWNSNNDINDVWEDINSGVQANHQYIYDNTSALTDSTRGYRQALIKIKPRGVGVNITSINLQIKHASAPSANTGWLDMSMNLPNCTSLTIGGVVTVHRWLEQFKLRFHSITSCANLFRGCSSLYSVIKFDTSNVTSFTGMFSGCSGIINIPDFDTSSATDMSLMFNACSSLQTIPVFDYSGVTTLFSFLLSCSKFWKFPELPTENQPINCTSFSQTFSNCVSLQTIPFLDISKATSVSSMFSGCTNLKNVGVSMTPAIPVSCTFTSMFANCISLVNPPPANLLATSKSTAFTSMFSGCAKLGVVPNYDVSEGTSFALMFNGCTGASTVFPTLNSTKGTNFASMFQNCTGLNAVFNTVQTTVAIDLTRMYYGCTKMVTSPPITVDSVGGTLHMDEMYRECVELTSTPIFTNTSRSIDMQNMFYNCSKLVTINAIQTQNVTNFTAMFYNCNMTNTYDFDFSSATTLTNMYQSCNNLVTVPDIRSGTNLTVAQEMFRDCTSLTTMPDLLNASSSGISLLFMYSNCQSLVNTVSYSNIKATNVSNMFGSCSSLITSPEIDTSISTSFASMFFGCTTLQTIFPYNSTQSTSFLSTFSSCPALITGVLNGTTRTISYSGCNLSTQAIVDIFTALGTAAGTQTITVSNNPGYAALTAGDRLIATNKGWTIA